MAADIIRWYIQNAGSSEIRRLGMNGRKNLEEKMTRDVSVNRSFGQKDESFNWS